MKKKRIVRCSPRAVAEAVALLDEEARRILEEDLKFHNMMKVDLDSLKRRDIVEAIYHKTEVVDGKIEIHISDDITIEVTIKRIEEILGLPRGTEEGESVHLPASAPNLVCDLFLQHPEILEKPKKGKQDGKSKANSKPNLKKMLIGATDLQKLMKMVDSKMKVRCFLMILLNRVLMPASGFHLNDKQATLAWDLDCVAKIDWCKLVFEHLSDCIEDLSDCDLEASTYSGCSLVLLIAVFEALVPSQCPKTEPSILGYNTETLKHLLGLVRSMVGVEKACDIDASTEQNRSDDFPESEEEIHALMKDMADHLNVVKFMVPTELCETIQCTLETFDALTKRIWPLDLWDPFYEANVLNVDNDSHGSHIIVQIGDHTITKATLSKSLKPDGWMSSFVLDAQCEIWRSQWPDKIILTTFASKELLESNKRTKSLDKELTEDKVKKATQIFVPVNVEEVHWILVVMDFKNKEVQILDSFQSNTYLVPAYQVATNLEMYLMTKFGMTTGFSKDRNLKLAKQTNAYDCGFHVLLYIQRYGRSDMYGIDTEQILCYRKQLAYELKHESNDHPSTSTQYIDESPLHVYSARPPSGSSRSPLHDLSSTKTPSVSGSSSSTSSDSLGGSKPNAGKEDTLSSSLGLNAEQEDAEVHNKPKRKRTKTDKTKVKTPVVPQRLHTETAHLLCDLVLKADPNNESSNLITLNSLVMTIKECATFLSGGSATLEMLKETLTLTVGLDIKENNRYRVIVGPMDMSTLDNDTGSEAFKDAVKTQMVVPSIPQTCMMVFLPVKKGSDWSVYCINKVCQRIDYLICSSNEEPMDAAELCKPLLKEVDFSTRKIFDFMDWSPAPVPFEKKISSSDTGLLAMYFMEMYNGKQFSLEVEDTKTWSESYRKSGGSHNSPSQIHSRFRRGRGEEVARHLMKVETGVPRMSRLAEQRRDAASVRGHFRQ